LEEKLTTMNSQARPEWVEAGRHLLAGLELAVREVNDGGGIGGRPLELVVRDTAADPQRATAAVDELARLGDGGSL
jgi:ABC-type branched-subunit amino acid transport system substrate-binding protein